MPGKIVAVQRNDTPLARRLAGLAYAPPMPDHAVTEIRPFLPHDHRHEVALNLDRVLLLCEPNPLGKAPHMGIHRDPGLLEAVPQHNIGRLAAHPRQSDEFSHRPGHIPPVKLHQGVRHAQERPGLVSKKPCRADKILKVLHAGPGHGRRRGILPKQCRRHHVDPLIRALRTQYRGRQQLEGAVMMKRALRVRVLAGKGHRDRVALRYQRFLCRHGPRDMDPHRTNASATRIAKVSCRHPALSLLMPPMKLVNDLAGVGSAAGPTGTAVTLGVYDGLHRGHMALVHRTVEEARTGSLTPAVITFSSHPLALLAPPYTPRKLIYPDRKAAVLSAAGVEVLATLDFDEEFAAQPAERFVAESLAGACRARVVVCGYDFAFGKSGAGTIATLRSEGEQFGLRSVLVDAVADDGVHVKSTMVRDLLLEGRIEDATRMLGRPYELRGHVKSGDGRGRLIGFPTANLGVDQDHLIPARGVYACTARIRGGETRTAMLNIGTNPTFGLDRLSIEANLLDFAGDLTDKEIEIHFRNRLRSEQKFESAQALVDQLHLDKARTENLASGWPPLS